MYLSVGLLAIILTQGGRASTDSQPPGRADNTTPLCELLESIAPGERRPATVHGILVAGYEATMLYDPGHTLCTLDVQPTTEVELSSNTP
jgi:hypothetical protein